MTDGPLVVCLPFFADSDATCGREEAQDFFDDGEGVGQFVKGVGVRFDEGGCEGQICAEDFVVFLAHASEG